MNWIGLKIWSNFEEFSIEFVAEFIVGFGQFVVEFRLIFGWILMSFHLILIGFLGQFPTWSNFEEFSIDIWLNFDVISIDFDWIFGSIWATDFVPLVLLWISGAVNRTSFRCISDFSEKEEKKEDFRRCLLSFAVVLRVRFRLFCGRFIQIRVTFTATSVTRGCDNWNKSVSLDGFHFLGLK